MWGNGKELINTLKNIERLKVGIMKQVNELNCNKDAVAPTTVYPMAKVQPMAINNYPVFQFSYEGMLPHFNNENREYNSMIKDYYFRATYNAYNFEQISMKFKHSVIIFVQYFKDKVIRDLENRNKKHIQDAIRNTGLINDDNWQNVWNMDLGYKDKEDNHVQVFVVEKENSVDFYSYLLENHEELKKDTPDSITKGDVFSEHQERIKSGIEEKEIVKPSFEGTNFF